MFNRLSFSPSSKIFSNHHSFHPLFTLKKFSMIHPSSIQIWQNHPKGTKPCSFSHISTSLLFIKLSFLLSFFFFVLFFPSYLFTPFAAEFPLGTTYPGSSPFSFSPPSFLPSPNRPCSNSPTTQFFIAVKIKRRSTRICSS